MTEIYIYIIIHIYEHEAIRMKHEAIRIPKSENNIGKKNSNIIMYATTTCASRVAALVGHRKRA